MRESIRAYASVLAIGFRAAPWHATGQLLTGVVFAMAMPVAALGAKLIVDAATTADLPLGLLAAALMALLTGGALICVFYYVDCLFNVMEQADALVSLRLMKLVGGTDGLAHLEYPEYLNKVHQIREEHGRLAGMVNATAGILRVGATLTVTGLLLVGVHPLLLLLPVLSGVSFWLGKVGRDVQVAAQEATSEPERLRRHLFQLGTSASTGKELRVFGITGHIRDRHHETSDAVLHRRNRAEWRSAVLEIIDGVLLSLGYVGGILLVLDLAFDGRATPGDVALVAALAMQLTGTIGLAVMYGTEFLYVMKVAHRFRWLTKYARAANPPVDDPAPLPSAMVRGIEVQDVCFGYPGADNHDVLSGASLHLPAGKVVALVGDNGAGKTTLVKLLCGFHQPRSGRITVDGVDLNRFEARGWRARVAAAFQDFASFEFSARETVGVGDLPRLDDRPAVEAALDRAGATSVVTRLPHGLDTQLGTTWDQGVDLSTGQWQKLALARGLMRDDPLLVVFDEPTAALDAHTEHALFERFAEAARSGGRRGAITLLISHRFSTVRMADLIVVLEAGKVREYGSHQELMSRGGLYAGLYELQSRAYR